MLPYLVTGLAVLAGLALGVRSVLRAPPWKETGPRATPDQARKARLEAWHAERDAGRAARAGTTAPGAAPPRGHRSRWVDATPHEAEAFLERARRARRSAPFTTMLGWGLAALLLGATPMWFWFDSRTVPAGASTTEVTVLGGERWSVTRGSSGSGARAFGITPAVAGSDRVTLDYRWQWPEDGDTLEVYVEDDRLRATNEGSTLELVGGALMTAVLLAIGVARVRARRAEIDERIAHFERLTLGGRGPAPT